ncbi:MAG TPA: DMT family transporter [Clostridia bacterium]|nr:DMT family transporter [Clostridia bacterium]
MTNRKAIALAFGTALTWGLAGVWVRLLGGLSGVFITGLRLAIALVALAPVLWLRRRKLNRADLRRKSTYVLAALLVSYYLIAVIAFLFTSIAEVALLIAVSPLLVLGVNLLRGIRVTGREKFGALCALIGVALVLGPKLAPGSFDQRRLIGDLLALASAGCSAAFASAYARVHKPGETSSDPFMVTVVALALGSATLLSASALLAPQDFVHLRSPGYLIPALGLGIITTAFPSIAYATAAKRLPAVLTTTIQLLIPIVSTVAAAIVLREMPSGWLLPGGVLVLFGIFTLVRSTRSPEVATEEELTNV